jgi:hypothetical protein
VQRRPTRRVSWLGRSCVFTAVATDRLVAAQMVVAVRMVEIVANLAKDNTGGARSLVDRRSWAYTTVAWHTAAVRSDADFVSATDVG